MIINAPSLANVSLMEMGDTVRELIDAGIDFFHIDIMDGHYVPNLCFPASFVKDLKEKYPQVTAEVHMMVDHPEDYVRQMKEYGADWLSFHLDSTRFVCRTAKAIREEGMKAGVVLNPSQPVSQLAPAAGYVDYVIFMAVEPGFSGQRFMEGAMERLEQLCEFRREAGLDFKIVIDGGVDYVTAKKCVELGADILVTGIYMQFRQPDGIMGACERFRNTFGRPKPDGCRG